MLYKRALKTHLEKALSYNPIVLLTGARQIGKTTLIKQIGAEHDYTYITFDDIRYLAAARNDPIGFISNLEKPVVLDEIQRAPELFLPIKQDIDEHRVPGRYALTGSTSPLLIPRLSDALVGRMILLELYPLSQGEILGSEESFIERIFTGKTLNRPIPTSIQELYRAILKGGYPLVQSMTFAEQNVWFNSYITTLLYRDVADLSQITGLTQLPAILKLLATRVGNLVNNAELSRVLAIPATTLQRYITLLKAVYIIEMLPAWSVNLGKRLVKSPKLYLIDTGLVASLNNLDQERFKNEMTLVGGVLENFVFGELKKQLSWSTLRIQLFHLRTDSGIEVDFVLEDPAGNVVGIEVKHSRTVSPGDFKGLTYLEESCGKRFMQGIVLYTGNESIPFGKKLRALPIQALWS